MIIFATLILSMYITIALIPPLVKFAHKIKAYDIPDQRKIHTVPKPRIGGLAMSFGIFIPLLFWIPFTQYFRALLVGSSMIIIFGILDDYKNINYKIKFLAQFFASAVVVFIGDVVITHYGLLIPQGINIPYWFSACFTIFIIIGVTNAINLSDGLDGLAGGVILQSFICIAYLAFCFDNISIALTSVGVLGAIFGFLRFNSYPSQLFMGDTGSQLLGFLAVTLSISLTQSNQTLSPVLPLLILGFPILDTITVLCTRILSGDSPFKADNRHFHHRLLKLGLFHSEAVLTIYCLQFLFVVVSYLFRFYSEWFLLLFYTIFSTFILIFFIVTQKYDYKFKRYYFFDRIVKGKLRILKEKGILIKFSFSVVKFLLPLSLFFLCFLPEEIPVHLSVFSLILLGILLISRKVNSENLVSICAVAFYLFVPMLVYLSDTNKAVWLTNRIEVFYISSFGILLFFVYLTLKFTRRQGGFKTNPLDFLIFFIVLIIPNLPDDRIKSLHLGPSAIKIIIFYLAFEVITGELRFKRNLFWLFSTAILLIILIRGF